MWAKAAEFRLNNFKTRMQAELNKTTNYLSGRFKSTSKANGPRQRGHDVLFRGQKKRLL